MQTRNSYKFGSFEFSARGVLTRKGQVVKLPPKERALLELLIENAGSIVGQREIEHRIWPRQDVSYSSISRCVYSLRKILGGGRK